MPNDVIYIHPNTHIISLVRRMKFVKFLVRICNLFMENIVFLSPIWLIIGWCMLIWYIFRFVIKWPSHTNIFAKILKKIVPSSPRGSIVYRVRHILTMVSILLFFVILAYPNKTDETQDITKTGIDIVVVLDLSKSMLADDFSPNRFVVAKQVLTDFIAKLESDRLWLVVFAGKPFTSVPLTFDYDFVTEVLTEMTTDTINQWLRALQGTAIGDALLSAVSVLEKWRENDSPPAPLSEGDTLTPSPSPNRFARRGEQSGDGSSREQIIVLLTDGESTPGTLDPMIVAQLGADEDISIYTVGIGSLEWWFLTYQTSFGIQRQQIAGIDETTLQRIAEMTDARYWRATDEQTFQAIFDEISQLSKSEITVSQHTTHIPYWKPLAWVLLSILFVLGILERMWRVDDGVR